MGRSNVLTREFIEERSCPDPNTGCWLWTRALDTNGYGQSSFNYVQMGAHRASWIAFNGAIPDGLYVCHRCDTKACVNPAHLFVGTQRDNMRDCWMKGRLAGLSGELSPNAKLTAAAVQEIRSACGAGLPQSTAAKQFGVSRSAVSMIMAERSWRSLARANEPRRLPRRELVRRFLALIAKMGGIEAAEAIAERVAGEVSA